VKNQFEKHSKYQRYWRTVQDLVNQLNENRRDGGETSGRDAIGLIQGTIDWLTQEQEAAVRSARLDGTSWNEIGDELGVSRQAASQRFGAFERLEGTADRCGAAGHLPGDETACVGELRAVKLLNSQEPPTLDEWRSGVYGCVHHGARLYAQLVYPKVRAASPAFEEAAQQVYFDGRTLMKDQRAVNQAARGEVAA